jgi:hypothetical protein
MTRCNPTTPLPFPARTATSERFLSILALRHRVLDDQGRLHQDLFLHANVRMHPSTAMTLCTFRKEIPTPMMDFTAQSSPSCACTIPIVVADRRIPDVSF